MDRVHSRHTWKHAYIQRFIFLPKVNQKEILMVKSSNQSALNVHFRTSILAGTNIISIVLIPSETIFLLNLDVIVY